MKHARAPALLAPVLFLAGCAVGPNYSRPAAIVVPANNPPPPDAFKEAQAAGLQPATPSDAFRKGAWWEIYNDADLNALEERVRIDNQNVLAAEANYREAKAVVRMARAGLFPTVTTGPAIGEAHSSGGGGSSNSAVVLARVLGPIRVPTRPCRQEKKNPFLSSATSAYFVVEVAAGSEWNSKPASSADHSTVACVRVNSPVYCSRGLAFHN
jgi:hypothetical protein